MYVCEYTHILIMLPKLDIRQILQSLLTLMSVGVFSKLWEFIQ